MNFPPASSFVEEDRNTISNESSTVNDDGELSLANLPTDILLHIFSLCEKDSWPVLTQVCRRFSIILGPDSFLWDQITRQLLFVNQSSSLFNLKIQSFLSARDRFRVHKNWLKGVCLVKPVTSIPEMHVLPWLVLKSNTLWVGSGNHIRAYLRVPPAAFLHHSSSAMRSTLNLTSTKGDLGRFVVKDGVVVAGDTNGSLFVWRTSNGKLLLKKINCHASEIAAVKLYKSVIVSGSRDKFVKIWSHSSRSMFSTHEMFLGDRILSLDIDPSGTVLCAGTGGHCRVPPSHLFDLTTGALICHLRQHFRDGEGVYDIHFESPNELLTGDFNSALRLWDLRTHENVRVWDDPHDSAVNCIATDNNMTILTGTATHGGIRLWDKRQTRCQQLYFIEPKLRSPVYSLDFDSSELYAALDMSILGFDFSGRSRKPNKDLVVYPCN